MQTYPSQISLTLHLFSYIIRNIHLQMNWVSKIKRIGNYYPLIISPRNVILTKTIEKHRDSISHTLIPYAGWVYSLTSVMRRACPKDDLPAQLNKLEIGQLYIRTIFLELFCIHVTINSIPYYFISSTSRRHFVHSILLGYKQFGFNPLCKMSGFLILICDAGLLNTKLIPFVSGTDLKSFFKSGRDTI